MIVIAVIVAPCPIFFLFFGRDPPEVSGAVPMSFVGPLPVVDNLVVVPHVIVGVVGIIDAIGMMFGAADSHHGSG
jgi:hypothetical protein